MSTCTKKKETFYLRFLQDLGGFFLVPEGKSGIACSGGDDCEARLGLREEDRVRERERGREGEKGKSSWIRCL